ncbi:proteophosphoglycan ppg4 [Rhodotorula toruloides]|uniref:Proteophosphoglycan ppg4 n=1 Tax=Rhodotorula toruloides TaxID=5286 RepID=A0A511KD44_RHOTO|nr:proteophosphoglycan ppg4 [Rhodotorula toruloides]
MNGPPPGEASTSSSFTQKHFTRSSSTAAATPSAPLGSLDKYLYTQPDYAFKTKDDGIPHMETKHAGMMELRRVFVGPSLTTGHASGGSASTAPVAKWKARSRDHEEEGDVFASEAATPHHPGLSFPMRRRPRASTALSIATTRTGQTVTSSVQGSSGGGQYSRLHEWTGTTFEIGGDIRDAAKRRDARLARQREDVDEHLQRERKGSHSLLSTRDMKDSLPSGQFLDYLTATPSNSMPPRSPAPTSVTGASFVTAQTQLPRRASAFEHRSPLPIPHERRFSQPMRRASRVSFGDGAATSDGVINGTPDKRIPPVPLRSILRAKSSFARDDAFSDELEVIDEPRAPASERPAPLYASVRFPEKPATANIPSSSRSGAEPPAPPEIVLARPDTNTPRSSMATDRPAAALLGLSNGEAEPKQPHRPWWKKASADGVLRKDRMLVRRDWTHREDLPDTYDEHIARKYPSVSESWQELAVVWRASGQIELWGEPSFKLPIFSKGKKLRGVIPLHPKKTHITLYSATDLVFCLTHRLTPHHVLTRQSARYPHHHDDEDEADEKGKGGHRKTRFSKASKRGYVHLGSSGTNIYLFRARTHSTAKAWIWHLYRALGGQLPPAIEVTVPGLGAKLRLPLPEGCYYEEDVDLGEHTDDAIEGNAYRHLQPAAVVDACIEKLAGVREWKDLVEDAKRMGANFRLAWRNGAILDWIQPELAEERKCDFSVVGGMAFRQARVQPILELRPAAHYPTTCRIPAHEGASGSHISSTIRISEPPGIEGFLVRHRPNGTPERVYLSSRMGLLFVCRPSAAHPPDPPLPVYEALNNPAAVVLAPFVFGMASLAHPNKKKREKMWDRLAAGNVRSRNHKQQSKRDWTLRSMYATADGKDGDDGAAGWDGNKMLEWLEKEEKKRTFLQITDARGFCSLSELASIEPELEDDLRQQFARVVDPGGNEGLQAADDKAKLRKMRSFVIKTQQGTTARFECHSIDVRAEWVNRLRALATYWRRRERVDANQLMELSVNSGLVNPIPARGAHRRHVYEDDPDDEGLPPPTRNEVLSSPHLTHLFNWCLLDGCRTLMQQRTMYVKQGLRGVFRLRHVVLLHGVLIEYQSIVRDLKGQPLPTPYHRRCHIVHLRDCYVYSGALASHLLPRLGNTMGWTPGDESEHQFPRCYSASDGLRTADDREDCTFVIVKIKHSKSGKGDKLGMKGVDARVYRTRSKLERDQFVYALNASVERLLRGEQERENRLRDFAWLQQH